jgi:hypothetical protein
LKRVFSTVLPKFYLWKQGLSDVLLFVISFLRLVLEYFFSPTQFLPMKAGIEWCAALCDFFLRLVLEYFSTVLPNF